MTTAPDVSPWLGNATTHYENFPVGSWLLPARIRPAVAALYRFARFADDVADEGDAAPAERLAELGRLRAAILRPDTDRHPVVDPLQPWIARFDLDRHCLLDLLAAFEQDVTVHRFADRGQVLDYCSRSANPVGRLMLQLFDRRDPDSYRASDAICSALQLINFLQDVGRDWTRGRVYLPQSAMRAAGVDDAAIARAVERGRCDPALVGVIGEEAVFARRLLESGRPLLSRVSWRLAFELRVILAAATHVLDRLQATGSDPVALRPVIGRSDAPAILVKMFR